MREGKPNGQESDEEGDVHLSDEQKVQAVRDSIARSRPRDPWASYPLWFRMGLGAVISILILLVFGGVGVFLFGDAGICLGLLGMFIGLWLPPHLHEYDKKADSS